MPSCEVTAGKKACNGVIPYAPGLAEKHADAHTSSAQQEESLVKVCHTSLTITLARHTRSFSTCRCQTCTPLAYLHTTCTPAHHMQCCCFQITGIGMLLCCAAIMVVNCATMPTCSPATRH
jgi:hypothetical protein